MFQLDSIPWDVDAGAHQLNVSLFGSDKNRKKNRSIKNRNKKENNESTLVKSSRDKLDSDDETFTKKDKKKLKERKRRQKKSAGKSSESGSQMDIQAFNQQIANIGEYENNMSLSLGEKKQKKKKDKSDNQPDNSDSNDRTSILSLNKGAVHNDKQTHYRSNNLFKESKVQNGNHNANNLNNVVLSDIEKLKVKKKKRKHLDSDNTSRNAGSSSSKRPKLDDSKPGETQETKNNEKNKLFEESKVQNGNHDANNLNNVIQSSVEKTKVEKKKKKHLDSDNTRQNTDSSPSKKTKLDDSKLGETQETKKKNKKKTKQSKSQSLASFSGNTNSNSPSDKQLNSAKAKTESRKGAFANDMFSPKSVLENSKQANNSEHKNNSKNESDSSFLLAIENSVNKSKNKNKESVNSFKENKEEKPMIKHKREKTKKKGSKITKTNEQSLKDGKKNIVKGNKDSTSNEPDEIKLKRKKDENVSPTTEKLNINNKKIQNAAAIRKAKILSKMLQESAAQQDKDIENTSPSKKKKKSQLISEPASEKEEDSCAVSSRPKINPIWGASASVTQQARQQLDGARFRHINEQMYTCTGQEAFQMFKSDPPAYRLYHEGYRTQVAKWNINPLDVIVKQLKNKPASLVVADFGCGEARLASSVPQTVHSFDLVALNPRVTACDMSKVPLSADSVDVCVFCLSLMGTNLQSYVKEAWRVLKDGGLLKVAEVASRFSGVSPFIAAMGQFGFRLMNKRDLTNMFYLMDFKKVPLKKKVPSSVKISLKPCVYKRR